MNWQLFWSIFLTNKEIFSTFVDMIDESIFGNAVMTNLLIITRKFLTKYHRAPDFDTLLLLVEKLPDSEIEHKQMYIDFINKVSSAAPTVDVDVFKDEMYKTLQNHEMEKFILRTANQVKTVNFESVITDIRSLMTKFQTHNLGIDITDAPRMVKMIRHQPVEKIPTGIQTLDKVLYGGWGTNEIAIVMAPPGRGKSAFLMNVMYNSMTAGKNALYITLELSERAAIRRLYGRIGYATKKDMLDEELVEKSANKFFSLTKAKGRIMYFPSKGITAEKIDGILEQLHMYYDFTPDVLIVDYLDLLAPRAMDQRLDPRHRLRGITEDLRSISLRRNIAVVTATQANRAALNKAKITEANMSESFGKVEVADVILALCQTEEEFRTKRMRMAMLKNRDNVGGGVLECFCDFERMVIIDIDTAFKQKLISLEPAPILPPSPLGL